MEVEPEKFVQKMMDNDPFSRWLGIEILKVSLGYCRLKMTVRPEMRNGFDTLHGGVSFAFADSALAFAANSRGILSVALNCSVTYPNPARVGDVLIAESKEVVHGHKTGTYDIEVKNENTGDLICLFRGTVFRTSRQINDL
jgi:acyl-CoA thioesterase